MSNNLEKIMLSAALDGITIHHIDESGNVVQFDRSVGSKPDKDVWSHWRGNGKVVLMNKGKEASPDLLNMGRTLVEINRRQEINPSDIKILKAYGITLGPEIEDIHGFCEKVWDWAKENL